MKKHTVQKAPFDIPLVSAYPSRKAWEVAAWHAVLDYIARLPSRGARDEFLRVVLTARERENLLMRAAALHRIQVGAGYRDISKELWLTAQTISAIKKSLREHSYRSYNERGKTERKQKVYSTTSRPKARNPMKRRVRTKYGTIEVRL